MVMLIHIGVIQQLHNFMSRRDKLSGFFLTAIFDFTKTTGAIHHGNLTLNEAEVGLSWSGSNGM